MRRSRLRTSTSTSSPPPPRRSPTGSCRPARRPLTPTAAAMAALRAAADPFVHLVQGANPAVAKQWELAIRDAYGVLGRLYIPVVQASTGVARRFGDTLAGLEPVFRPAIRSIAYLASTVGNE